DWEHFSQVVMHMFINPLPDFAIVKARQLADQAVMPDAPLMDISYCWEALGPTALPFVTPLMTNPKQDVAFAAARAAVFLGDVSAENVLLQMARTSNHPFQLTAVQTLAKLPPSPEINEMLRELLDSDQTLVRLEAYRALADNGDAAIISRPIADKFRLDIVPSKGPPLIYASRSGMPRIAVIGTQPRMNLPVMFTAMENRLSISSDPSRPLLTVFYRGAELRKPISFASSPDVPELIARLGGDGASLAGSLDFTYCEVVSLLQMMGDQQRLSAPSEGKLVPVAFVLQEPPRVEQTIEKAPIISDAVPEKLGSAADSGTNLGR
ncbi:MAG TPA: HEAT repeat domain-containing protein, partial [Tepidisphaeraceae bacterium]|nr:HEAT repeat domain-containing protein [Tepidisphaeraceae bacterium]